jgi:hypothetical protein
MEEVFGMPTQTCEIPAEQLAIFDFLNHNAWLVAPPNSDEPFWAVIDPMDGWTQISTGQTLLEACESAMQK